jgi:hypothetical protein
MALAFARVPTNVERWISFRRQRKGAQGLDDRMQGSELFTTTTARASANLRHGCCVVKDGREDLIQISSQWRPEHATFRNQGAPFAKVAAAKAVLAKQAPRGPA